MKTTPRIVSCPTCQKPVPWDERSPARPFCSERCQLIDFGAWAGERHVIAGESVAPDPDASGADDPLLD